MTRTTDVTERALKREQARLAEMEQQLRRYLEVFGEPHPDSRFSLTAYRHQRKKVEELIRAAA